MSAIGGENVTTTIEGRARYPVNVRYPRELRDNMERLSQVLVSTPAGAQIPISQIADIKRVNGPSMIRDENGMLAGYVFVDLSSSDIGGYVEHAKQIVREKLSLPTGYSLVWSGQYENMLRVRERLKIVVPDHPVSDLCPAVHEHQIGDESINRHACGSILTDRRRLAHVDPRLQHFDCRLGRHDRTDGP